MSRHCRSKFSIPLRQGQLQSVLKSPVSLASIIGPLAFSTFYFVVQKEWPGAIYSVPWEFGRRREPGIG